MVQYTFGDDDPAVARLGLVAAAYASVSEVFLRSHTSSEPDVVLDLGCGPGFSTQLLQSVCRPHRLVGLDASPEFLRVAGDHVPAATFQLHDATVTPLPHGPAAVIYARLLLAHLPDPVEIARRWAEELAPGGVLLIEDLEDIEAPPGPLRDYDEVSASIVRQGGGVMYAGAALSSLGGSLTRVTVPAALAARIYAFNVRRWLADAAFTEHDDTLRTLSRALDGLIEADDDRPLSWVVRQIVCTS